MRCYAELRVDMGVLVVALHGGEFTTSSNSGEVASVMSSGLSLSTWFELVRVCEGVVAHMTDTVFVGGC